MKLYLADINNVNLSDVQYIDAVRQQKVMRLRQTDDKKRCIAGGLLINRLLGNVEVSTTEYGKPVAQGGVHFNISHSGRYVLFAISDAEVGCDIQHIGYVKALDMAKVICSDNEINILRNSADRLTAFYDMWTKKESLLKCLGCGFHRSGKSADTSADTFYENGVKYFFKGWNFSDYTITVCSVKNNFPSVIEFIYLGE